MNDSTFSKDPASVEFNSSMGTPSGRKARFGDPERVLPEVSGHVRAAHDAFVSGLTKVTQLADDETRTLVVKHDSARTVTLRTVAAIERSQHSIIGVADGLDAQAMETINRTFAADPAKVLVYDRIERWIGETAPAKEGIQRIRDEMKEDPDIVITLHHSKPYIMGLAKEVRLRLIDAGVEMHAPEAMQQFEKAKSLRNLAGKYSKVTKGIRSSWFNNALAEKAKSRVEI